MVEFPLVGPVERKGFAAPVLKKSISDGAIWQTLISCHPTAHPTQDVCGKLPHPPQASTRG
jgi:hypothetical protein